MIQPDELPATAEDGASEGGQARPPAHAHRPSNPQVDELAREVDRLRTANLRLTLDLQAERARRRVGDSDAPGSRHRVRWPRLFAPSWSVPVVGAGSRTGTMLADALARRLPVREGASAAPWRLSGWEVGALVVVVVAAILLRFVGLASAPPGVQGDESAIALEAQRVHRDGWIGPYSGTAAGTPTGAIYVVAGLQAVMGDSILTVRVGSALFGVLTVAALVLVVRRSFGRAAGIVAGALLATMGWHIHYSRLGFPNVLWPFFVATGLGAIVEALRENDRRWWAAAGLLVGLGVYTYNSHVIVIAIILGYLAIITVGPMIALLAAALAVAIVDPGVVATIALAAAAVAIVSTRANLVRGRVGGLLLFGAVLCVVASPMIGYATDEANNYFGYSERLSVTNSAEWAQMPGTADRVGWVADRYRDYWNRMCCDPAFDGVDATGTVPLVPRTTLVLAAIGIVLAVWQGRRLLASIGSIIVLVIPMTSVMSVDFALRRTLIETVFLAMFAAVGIVFATSLAWQRAASRYVVVPLLGLLAVVSIRQNLDDYFYGTLASTEVRWVNAVEMVEASQYIATLPPGSYVYFMTDRWPYSLEIRRYFAPNVPGEDRTEDFGENRLPYETENGRPVYILIGSYEDRLTDLQRLYPGGAIERGGSQEDPDFVAYFPPWPPRTPERIGATGTQNPD